MSHSLRLIFARTSAWPSSLYQVLRDLCADGFDREAMTVHECAPTGNAAFAPMRARILGAAGSLEALGEGRSVCIADDPLSVLALRQLHPTAPYAIVARPGQDALSGIGHREVSSVPNAPQLLTEVVEQAEVLLSTVEPLLAPETTPIGSEPERIHIVPPVIVSDHSPLITSYDARSALGLPVAARVVLVAWESGPDSTVHDLRQLLDGILRDSPAARVLLLPIGERNESVDAFQSLRWMQGRVSVLNRLAPAQEALHFAAADAVYVEPALADNGLAIRASAAGIRVMVRRKRGGPGVLTPLLPPEAIVSDLRTAVSRLSRIPPDTAAERTALRARTLAFAGADAQRARFERLVERLASAPAPRAAETLPSWHPFSVSATPV